MEDAMRHLVTDGLLWALPLLCVVAAAQAADAPKLLIGAATRSITPDQPVAVSGQFHTRIARKVDNPCTATALALEAREGDRVVDQAILVSCDLVAIREGIQDAVRKHLAPKLNGFDIRKLVLSATHTHTAPVMREGIYQIPKDGVMQPTDYVAFLCERVGEAAVEAWESRKPGGVSWAFGHAVVGHNRRATYENGTARMYGKTDTPDFRCIEGYEDHGLDVLFFWDAAKALKAIAINPACPSQEVEGLSTVNADYWHDVREALHKKHSPALAVVAWCGAAGDQSPHLLWRKGAEERMRRLRGLSRTQEIARRIVAAVDDVIELARRDIRTRLPFAHKVADIKLPLQTITEADYARYKTRYDQLANKPDRSPAEHGLMRLAKRVVDRYERQQTHRFADVELHVLRLGDVAIATNPFELYLDYGVQIKARSKAVQTLLIQLACDCSGYLPTERAVRGGHYSTEIMSYRVGPKGGKQLVEYTLAAINELWPDPKSQGGAK
jgi:hypothetical protein